MLLAEFQICINVSFLAVSFNQRNFQSMDVKRDFCHERRNWEISKFFCENLPVNNRRHNIIQRHTLLAYNGIYKLKPKRF